MEMLSFILVLVCLSAQVTGQSITASVSAPAVIVDSETSTSWSSMDEAASMHGTLSQTLALLSTPDVASAISSTPMAMTDGSTIQSTTTPISTSTVSPTTTVNGFSGSVTTVTASAMPAPESQSASSTHTVTSDVSSITPTSISATSVPGIAETSVIPTMSMMSGMSLSSEYMNTHTMPSSSIEANLTSSMMATNTTAIPIPSSSSFAHQNLSLSTMFTSETVMSSSVDSMLMSSSGFGNLSSPVAPSETSSVSSHVMSSPSLPSQDMVSSMSTSEHFFSTPPMTMSESWQISMSSMDYSMESDSMSSEMKDISMSMEESSSSDFIPSSLVPSEESMSTDLWSSSTEDMRSKISHTMFSMVSSMASEATTSKASAIVTTATLPVPMTTALTPRTDPPGSGTTSSASISASEEGLSHGGRVAIAVVFSLLGVAIIAVVIFFVYRKRNRYGILKMGEPVVEYKSWHYTNASFRDDEDSLIITGLTQQPTA